MAFQLWTHRNGILHGTTAAKQLDIRNKLLHLRIAEVYQFYTQDSTCVAAAAAQNLFEIPRERLLLRNRQYKICWLRSVEAAIAFQRRELETLQRQASRFFGVKAAEQQQGEWIPDAQGPLEVVPGIERRHELYGDITSPASYNLRRRRRGHFSGKTEEDDPAIPPAMFEKGTVSSYSYSYQADVRLRGYDPIEASEVASLLRSLPSVSTDETIDQSAVSAGSLLSSYTDEDQRDIALRGYDPIALSELGELGQSSSPSMQHSSAASLGVEVVGQHKLVRLFNCDSVASSIAESLDIGRRVFRAPANVPTFSASSSVSRCDYHRSHIHRSSPR